MQTGSAPKFVYVMFAPDASGGFIDNTRPDTRVIPHLVDLHQHPEGAYCGATIAPSQIVKTWPLRRVLEHSNFCPDCLALYAAIELTLER